MDKEVLPPADNKPKPKSMKNLEDIMAEYIANGDVNLDANEKRLLDRQVHQKTGKRVGKFKATKKAKAYGMPVVSARDSKYGQAEGLPHNMRVRKEPKVSSAVSVNGAIS